MILDFDCSGENKIYNNAPKDFSANSENKAGENVALTDIWNDNAPIHAEITKLFDELLPDVNENPAKAPTDVQFIEILKKFDLDHDGKISANEITSAWIDVNEVMVILGDNNPANAEIKKLFKRFMHRDGSFDSKKFIKRAGLDGKLNLSELTSSAVEGESEDYDDLKVNINDKTRNTFYDAIKKFDANNDHKLDADELAAIWSDGDPRNKEIKKLFIGFMNNDGTANKEKLTQLADGDGKIGIEEIIRYANRTQNAV